MIQINLELFVLNVLTISFSTVTIRGVKMTVPSLVAKLVVVSGGVVLLANQFHSSVHTESYCRIGVQLKIQIIFEILF